MQPTRGVVTQVTSGPAHNAVALRVQPEDLGADVLVHFQGKGQLAGLVAAGDRVELHGHWRLVNLTTGAIFEHTPTASSGWGAALALLLVVGLLVASELQWGMLHTLLPRPPTAAAVMPLSSPLVWRRPLMQGKEVKLVQQRLWNLGYLDNRAVDSAYGATTAAAVRRFQQHYGLVPDGKVGQQTWTLLFSDHPMVRSAGIPGEQR
jgi:hypothetical protein